MLIFAFAALVAGSADPVKAYITPEKFEEYRLAALEMGFSYCASAPLVRSSYLADAALEAVKKVCKK